MEQIAAPIKLCLTSKCHISKKALKIGETGANFDMKGFDLAGKTGIKDKSYYTEGLNACTGGVVIGNRLNMFHENSSLYEDAENAKRTIFPKITDKILKMAQETKEKIQVGLFGGWGYGSNKNVKEVDKEIETKYNLEPKIQKDITQTTDKIVNLPKTIKQEKKEKLHIKKEKEEEPKEEKEDNKKINNIDNEKDRKKETKEDKALRKKLLKMERKERRAEKKKLKNAFKEEKVTQQRQIAQANKIVRYGLSVKDI